MYKNLVQTCLVLLNTEKFSTACLQHVNLSNRFRDILVLHGYYM